MSDTLEIREVVDYPGYIHGVKYYDEDPEIAYMRVRNGSEGQVYKDRDDALDAEFATYGPGGYNMIYMAYDCEIACPACARKAFENDGEVFTQMCTINFEVTSRGEYCGLCEQYIIEPFCSGCGTDLYELNHIRVFANDSSDDAYCANCVQQYREKIWFGETPGKYDMRFDWEAPGVYSVTDNGRSEGYFYDEYDNYRKWQMSQK